MNALRRRRGPSCLGGSSVGERSLGLEWLESRLALAAAWLLKDVNSFGVAEGPTELTSVGGIAFFTADDGVAGSELWKSDGTAAGTVLVKDIRPGSLGSIPVELTNVNGVLYFAADNGTTGANFGRATARPAAPSWSRTSTTAPVIQIPHFWKTSTVRCSFPHAMACTAPSCGRATAPKRGRFWLVKDIGPGLNTDGPHGLTSANGMLFFIADDGDHGSELWVSNGTAAGTAMVKDIVPGSTSGLPNDANIQLTAIGGTVFFGAFDAANGIELWKSNGAATGTVLVKNIASGTSSSNPAMLTNVNGTLYFQATTAATGTELWKSDGTSSGTVLVKDIATGTASSSPENFTNVNGTVFFAAAAGGGNELWKTNGTSAGTVLVKDIRPGSASSFPGGLKTVNGTLFFVATDGLTGREVWQSNGTSAGTFLVQDIFPGDVGSIPRGLANLNGTLIFSADDGVHGRELWKGPTVTPPQAAVGGPTFQASGLRTEPTAALASASKKLWSAPPASQTFSSALTSQRLVIFDAFGSARRALHSDRAPGRR